MLNFQRTKSINKLGYKVFGGCWYHRVTEIESRLNEMRDNEKKEENCKQRKIDTVVGGAKRKYRRDFKIIIPKRKRESLDLHPPSTSIFLSGHSQIHRAQRRFPCQIQKLPGVVVKHAQRANKLPERR